MFVHFFRARGVVRAKEVEILQPKILSIRSFFPYRVMKKDLVFENPSSFTSKSALGCHPATTNELPGAKVRIARRDILPVHIHEWPTIHQKWAFS